MSKSYHTGIFTLADCIPGESRNLYIHVKATNCEEAREMVFARFGRNWSFQYDGDDRNTEQMIKEFDLKPFCFLELGGLIRPLFIEPKNAIIGTKPAECIYHLGQMFVHVTGRNFYASATYDSDNCWTLHYDDDGVIDYDSMTVTPNKEVGFNIETVKEECRYARAEHFHSVREVA